jgi:gp16 family phage-associated protein
MSLALDNKPGPGRRRVPRPSAAALRRVRDRLDREGLSIADWARENGEDPNNVNAVLVRGGGCSRGARHRIAVKLGLKDGIIPPESGEADNQPTAARSDNRPAGAEMLP